jgi:hypothetical protein
MGGGLVVQSPGTPPPPDAECIRQFMQVTTGGFDAYGSTLPMMIGNEASVRQSFGTMSRAVDTTLAVTSRFPPLGDWPCGRTRIVAGLSLHS